MLGFGRSAGRQVEVFSREGCHLCEEVLATLARYRRRHRLEITVHDINSNPVWLENYHDKIPVVRIDGRDRFFGQVDEVLLRRVLDPGS
ncbi:MAG: glutaredoxin family protein [Planctomycetes bacterium]|nr:glutaredoxin family protein [Planctomycetota bacterium]